MKKESGANIQDIEKKYGFNSCKKTEYAKRLLKEFTKFDKKLVKIDNYEKMKSNGKALNEEMLGLISRKPDFENHIKSLKVALKHYKESLRVEDEPLAVVQPGDVERDVKTRLNEFSSEIVKRLSQFFAVACILDKKDHLNPNPLSNVPEGDAEAIQKIYSTITSLPQNGEAVLNEKINCISTLMNQLINGEELANIIEKILGENNIKETQFTIKKKRDNEHNPTQIISMPKEREESSIKESAPIYKEIVHSEPTHEEPIHKEPAYEKQKHKDSIHEESAHEEPTHEEPIHEEPIHEQEPIIKEKSIPDPEVQQEENQRDWNEDNMEDEDSEEKAKNDDIDEDYIFERKKDVEEEFETFVSKADERKKEKEEKRSKETYGNQKGGRQGKFGAGMKGKGIGKKDFKKKEAKKEVTKEPNKESKKETEEKTKPKEDSKQGHYKENYKGGRSYGNKGYDDYYNRGYKGGDYYDNQYKGGRGDYYETGAKGGRGNYYGNNWNQRDDYYGGRYGNNYGGNYGSYYGNDYGGNYGKGYGNNYGGNYRNNYGSKYNDSYGGNYKERSGNYYGEMRSGYQY